MPELPEVEVVSDPLVFTDPRRFGRIRLENDPSKEVSVLATKFSGALVISSSLEQRP